MKISLAAITLLKSVAAAVPSSWEGTLNNQLVRRGRRVRVVPIISILMNIYPTDETNHLCS